jgi:hypothetical protein
MYLPVTSQETHISFIIWTADISADKSRNARERDDGTTEANLDLDTSISKSTFRIAPA